MKRALLFSSLFVVLVLAAACGTGTDELGQKEAGLKPPQVCTQLAILCPEGKVGKRVGNCNWACVPVDACETDADCQINCLVAPCPTGYCAGNQCKLRDNGPSQSSLCSPDCKSGEYCAECKGVDGPVYVCLPDGAAC